jgi:hypothetical protein
MRAGSVVCHWLFSFLGPLRLLVNPFIQYSFYLNIEWSRFNLIRCSDR